MYTDRTRGGRATECATVDLDDAHVSDDRVVLYKGTRPLSEEVVGRGAYGEVVKLRYFTDGARLTLKRQQANWVVLANLRVAEALEGCGLTDFKSMRVDDEVWTLMEALDSDCSRMAYSQRRTHADEYAAFLTSLRDCLLHQGASFTDMKLQNTAVKRCARGKVAFRLIDLDGIDDSISTYPAVASFATNCSTAEEKRVQTYWSFAVTAMLFEQRRPSAARPFYFNTLAPMRDRRNALMQHYSNTPTSGVASLILDAVDVVEAYVARRT